MQTEHYTPFLRNQYNTWSYIYNANKIPYTIKKSTILGVTYIYNANRNYTPLQTVQYLELHIQCNQNTLQYTLYKK